MKKRLAVGLGAVALVVTAGTGAAVAKNGADDPAGHDRDDDRVARATTPGTHARRGADDGPRHDAKDDKGGHRDHRDPRDHRDHRGRRHHGSHRDDD